MSFQPPPPPGAPPPPPPGQWGPPPGGGQPAFDPKNVNPLDWALVGIGAVLFLFSFFEYYTASIASYSDSSGAWHFGDGGFIGWFAFIAGLAGAAVVALNLFVPSFKLPLPTYVAAMGLFALSTLLYLLGFIVIGPDDSACGGNSQCENLVDDAFSFGFSYWLSLILVIAGVVLALMRSQQTGQKAPGALGGVIGNLPNIGDRGPQGPGPGPGPQPGPGGYPPQPPPPPPPGYGPPQ
jgi:hypothetical protein